MTSPLARLATLTWLALGVATVVACKGGGDAPEFESVDRQVVQVGVQLSLTLVATDADGDDLDFSFSSTIPDVQGRADLTRSPSGAAIWRWTPLAADVGVWYVDFVASDGDNQTTLTVEIEVKSAVGGVGAPVFRQPLGTGTTLDLEDADCLDVDILVEDQDSTSVVIAQEAPVIEGATIQSTGGLTGTWRWCPTPEQIASDDDRYTLTLSADDLTNPKTLKNYLVVLRKPGRPECPGEPPVIVHTAMDASTVGNLTVDAEISDDQGLKQPPLFYYRTANPGGDPDVGQMTQLTMLLIDGSMQDGTWAVDVPNPVAGMPQGSQATLYYVIVADDDDDATGDCDHVTESTVYAMTVTNPGGAGGAAVCTACTADVQCGDASDLCVRVGVMNEPFCLQACSGPADCPSGYSCSASAVTSVDGATGRQCVPDSGSCTGGAACVDDLWEDNDTRAQAAANGPLPANELYDLTSCPLVGGGGDDEDFFELSITADSQVVVELAGGDVTDLDLALQTSTGTVLQSSTSLSSDETITRCLTPGTYYVRVYAWGTGANDYLLAYDRTAQSCASACVDDAHEPDDDAVNARETTYPVHSAGNNTICTSDDWFAVDLFNGEHLTVDLTFTQTNAQQDLDLHLIAPGGTDLTPCTESNPSTCTAAQGQSATSNEHYEFTAPAAGCGAGCTYHVVVHGWAGSKNAYSIQIEVE